MKPERKRLRRLVATLAVLALALAIAACGGGSSDGETTGAEAVKETTTEGSIKSRPQNAKVTLKIGSQDSPEQEILAEIYAQALAAAGYRVKTVSNLDSEAAALKAVKAGQISGYPGYLDDILTSFFGYKAEDIPAGPNEAWSKGWREANAEFAKEGLEAINPSPVNRAYAVGTLQSTVEKYGLLELADLKGVSGKLSVYGPPGCEQQFECLSGVEQRYGLKFKSFTPGDISRRYGVLENGEADLSIVYTTDPQLAAEEERFVILEDLDQVLPLNLVTFVTKKSTTRAAGLDYKSTIRAIQYELSAWVMRELITRVEGGEESPEDAAAAYLKGSGYVG